MPLPKSFFEGTACFCSVGLVNLIYGKDAWKAAKQSAAEDAPKRRRK
jgi:hypothetical protein